MKKYKYDSKRYLLSVTIPGFFMILILIYALFNNYTNFNLNIYSLLIIVCTYGIFNTFISSSNPKKIIIGSNVWIGCRSLILKGVELKNNTIVAAASVISHSNTEENSIINSNRIIKNNVIWKE